MNNTRHIAPSLARRPWRQLATFLAAIGSLATMRQPAVPGRDTPEITRGVGVYDTSTNSVTLVGGNQPPAETARDRSWRWLGTQWEVTSNDGPAARTNAAAAYDRRRRVAVVAGGAALGPDGKSTRVLNDTWEQRGGVWHRLSGTAFDPRDHHAMAYDETREAVVLFGGIPGSRVSPWPSDTWQLNPGGWQQTLTDGPSGRARTAMVYDRKRKQIVLFGGVGAAPRPGAPQPFLQDTWVLDRSGWRQLPVAGPPARYAHGMVFDERAGVVLLYSGAAAHKGAPLTDMWKWDGVRWTEIPLSGPTPGHRYQPVMVYDRKRARTVLYGGMPGSRETWEWNGARWMALPAER